MGRAAFLLALLAVLGCGTQSDIFGSMDNVPRSGVAPYTKVDLDPDADLTQPFIRIPEASGVEYREPAALVRDGVFHLWVERAEFLGPDQGTAHARSAIVHLASGDGFWWDDAADGAEVLAADRPWEDAFVGAPTVLHRDGVFKMWYAGGDGHGIGYAESADGDAWSKPFDDPVFVPAEAWEAGTVFAPCVVHDRGSYWMAYSAGESGVGIGVATGSAIGAATSADGFAWTRPRTDPVLVPTQPWEGRAVSSPTLLVDEGASRTIVRMWYTGNVPGTLFVDDASVGYAGSLDYEAWEKAETPVNPVLQEIFPLTFPGITDFLLYDEAQPTVVRRGKQFFMYFIQLDALNALSGGKRGLAVATNPPVVLEF
jgi:hypothetical protein